MIEIPDDKFLDDNYDISVGDGTIVLSSWSDGHTHLYLYSYNQGDPVGGGTKLERQLTKGDFEVEEILRVDHAARIVDYASNEGNLPEQQLWQVDFDGERKQLTTGAGNHEGEFCSNGGRVCGRAIDAHGAADDEAVRGGGQVQRRFGQTKRLRALSPARAGAA